MALKTPVMLLGAAVAGALVLAVGSVPSSAGAGDNPWARAVAPAQGPSKSIGGYSAGCVQGAAALPLAAPGFIVAKPARRRYFGHPALVSFVRDLASASVEAGHGGLVLGDLGQARGGPAPSGHASHQSGLDADIWFWAPPSARTGTIKRRARARLRPRAVVTRDTHQPTKAWSPRVEALLRAAASDKRVARIFVNPAIKKQLCEQATGDRTWLRRVRPWWGHDSHFHVRLHCPADSPECTPQPPLPKGDGCGEIAWWLDDKAQAARRKGRKRYRKKVGARPALPASCAAIAPAAK